MSKRLESGFVVAVAALTVVTTATVIHDGNGGKPDQLTKWVTSGFKHAALMVNQWEGRGQRSAVGVPATAEPQGEKQGTGQVKGGTTPQEPSSRTTSQLDKQNSPAVSSDTLPSNLSSSSFGGWTSQDIAELQSIGAGLAGSMSPQDWMSLEQDLTLDNPSQAETEIVNLLNTHLSTADKQWILSHFTGAQAFTPNDVALLQQTVQQLQNNLTPDEQTLLTNSLRSYFMTKQTP